MANIDNPNGFQPYRQVGGGVPPVHWYKHTADDAAAIAVGDAVILDDAPHAGYIKIALETSGSLLGVAASACAASTLGDVAVYDSPDTEFVGQCEGNSAQALVTTMINIKGTTGIMEVDQGQTDEAVIVVTGLLPSDEIGANGRVIFKICKHQLANVQTA